MPPRSDNRAPISEGHAPKRGTADARSCPYCAL